MYPNMGLAAVAQLFTAGTVGSSGKPIRVFTVAMGGSDNLRSCMLYNGTSYSGCPYITVLSGTSYFDSAIGIRFPNGCFAICTTATISYIEEF